MAENVVKLHLISIRPGVSEDLCLGLVHPGLWETVAVLLADVEECCGVVGACVWWVLLVELRCVAVLPCDVIVEDGCWVELGIEVPNQQGGCGDVGVGQFS